MVLSTTSLRLPLTRSTARDQPCSSLKESLGPSCTLETSGTCKQFQPACTSQSNYSAPPLLATTMLLGVHSLYTIHIHILSLHVVLTILHWCVITWFWKGISVQRHIVHTQQSFTEAEPRFGPWDLGPSTADRTGLKHPICWLFCGLTFPFEKNCVLFATSRKQKIRQLHYHLNCNALSFC